MNFCIIVRETHPDRAIEEVLGPFLNTNRADVELAAQNMYDAESNKNRKGYESRRFDYHVWELSDF